jgi:hypothetical protein
MMPSSVSEVEASRPTLGSMFDGAYVRLSYDEQRGVTITILPQVAFRHPAGDERV